MKVIFISKCWNFYVGFENAIEFAKNVDGFEDNCISTCCGSFCQLWEEFMWLAVNVLKNGPKISDPSKRHDTELNSSVKWVSLGQLCKKKSIFQKSVWDDLIKKTNLKKSKKTCKTLVGETQTGEDFHQFWALPWHLAFFLNA